MSLSKVGASANVVAADLNAGGTITLTFTPDSSFSAGDLLVALVASGARSAGSTYTHLQGVVPADRNTVSADWTILDYNAAGGGAFYQTIPYWTLVYHTVTSGEAGASPITCTVTLGTVSTVGSGTGYLLGMAGVAVRGSTGIVSLYVPADSTDTDNVVSVSGATPQAAAWPAANSNWYVTEGTGGTILLYGWSVYDDNMTASSVVWTGPTELDDDLYQNLLTAPAVDEDFAFSSAYELLGVGDAWPADSLSHTFALTSGGQSSYAFRLGIAVDGAPPAVEGSAPYEFVSTKVDVFELPYSIHTGMV